MYRSVIFCQPDTKSLRHHRHCTTSALHSVWLFSLRFEIRGFSTVILHDCCWLQHPCLGTIYLSSLTLCVVLRILSLDTQNQKKKFEREDISKLPKYWSSFDNLQYVLYIITSQCFVGLLFVFVWLLLRLRNYYLLHNVEIVWLLYGEF